MRKFKKKTLKWDYIFLTLFIGFLVFFPNLKRLIGNQSLNNNRSNYVLRLTDNLENNITNIFSNFLDYFKSKSTLIGEINDLKGELANNNDINSSSRANLISPISNLDDSNYIVTNKIFTDWTSIYDTILLNKGSKDGVRVGDIVSIDKDLVIGSIIEVSMDTSLATLYSKNREKVEGVIRAIRGKDTLVFQDFNNSSSSSDSNNSSTSSTTNSINSVRVNNQKNNNLDNILIDVYGYGGGDFMAEIPGNIQVELGTKVYLAIDENKIIGEVVKIEKRDASYYQRLLIKGYYNSRINNNYYIFKN